MMAVSLTMRALPLDVGEEIAAQLPRAGRADQVFAPALPRRPRFRQRQGPPPGVQILNRRRVSLIRLNPQRPEKARHAFV